MTSEGFLQDAVTCFRRCPKRPCAQIVAPTPLRVFDSEVVVPQVGRFTVYKCDEKEIVRVAFVDDTRAEFVLGNPTFTVINVNGRFERTFAVPGDAAQYADALQKFHRVYKAPICEETDTATRHLAESELRRIETLRLKQKDIMLRNEEMLESLTASRQRCLAALETTMKS